MLTDIQLTVPEEFRAFPYNPPYSIQIDLMRHLYAAIEYRKLAIVESPTGTGKTLSLLTSSLTWLRDDRDRIKKVTLESLRNSLHSADDPEWVVTQTFDRLKKEIEVEDHALEEHLAHIRTREQALRRECSRVTKRPRLSKPEASKSLESDDSFLPDREGSNSQEGQANAMSRLNDDELAQRPSSAATSSPIRPTKLSQVVHELLKLKSVYATSGDMKNGQGSLSDVNESSSHLPRSVSLASRAHLCINEQLRAKTLDLDEGCRNMLTGRPEERCPYLPPLGEEHLLRDLRDRILAYPRDIEDLVLMGKEAKLCPYFSSRSAISSAEFVTLPYSLLLQQRSRQVLDIDLKDQIILIDEAHNLIETLLQLHTIELSTSMLRLAIRQLTEYLNRFRTRLTTVHAIHLKRLTLFLRALNQFADSRFTEACQSPTYEDVMSVSAFVDGIGNKVNGINFLELQSYLTASKMARKVSGYAEKKAGSSKCNEKDDSSAIVPLHAVEAFIATLTNDIEDGIITFTADKLMPGEKHIKYQHLNPATHFDEIIRSARCVILAGGTMSPISDMSLQLFPTIPDEQLSVFSCGHVIPQSNLQCLVIGKGPRGEDLQFKFKSRGDQSLIDELGQCLFNVVSISPNGMVVFFPSYSFFDKVKDAWSSNGLLGRIQRKKQIFYEPHESAVVENVLRDYSLACTQTVGTAKGALLLAVVGAKLSEGLNFADELARAVVLVGIPYPNLASPELRERMKYINKRTKNNKTGMDKDAGNELYENLAMRAVNQSIGRAIRHRNDWSSLILIDSRYGSQKVQIKLPAWIRQNIIVPQSFGQAVKSLSDFYRAKRL